MTEGGGGGASNTRGSAGDEPDASPPGYAPLHSLQRHDLGGMLLLFYWYYGYHLDTSCTVVMLHGEATRLARCPDYLAYQDYLAHPSSSSSSSSFDDGFLPHDPCALSLNDPARPDSDIGAKAFRFGQVRELFRQSYRRLLRRAARHAASAADRHTRAKVDAYASAEEHAEEPS